MENSYVFRCLEGLNVLPGQIFAVSDAMRQGARLSWSHCQQA